MEHTGTVYAPFGVILINSIPQKIRQLPSRQLISAGCGANFYIWLDFLCSLVPFAKMAAIP